MSEVALSIRDVDKIYGSAGTGVHAVNNLSMDIRNAIHGLEVWPYED